ncbi:hypothetical protein Srot_1390 [Segniliparus rotundus DSM 44985]|uniref:Uncharacterized protein n=1 Tax=Segniliparus rotundus (strain ATCC BAA-972 / CDC 1076 / CIP 108378 / DSM 44985 / JCM 13578) TaxID=640132 RepID=D6Z7C4_SEGRD|nr:hypothetical protein [Segniliparus rotundus]ADG97854.1 hypothetical protein Srot_1390 [Segniliparus rotundus DSM 44985]
MTETPPAVAPPSEAERRQPPRGVRGFLTAAVLAVFAAAVWIFGYSGWFVVTSVWGDDPDPPSVAFAAGVVLAVVGGLVVAASSLVSVLHRLEVLHDDQGPGRWLHFSWTTGELCALAGLVVLVALGVVMVALSQFTATGKAVVIGLFALCVLIPFAPAYEIWRRRAGAKAD